MNENKLFEIVARVFNVLIDEINYESNPENIENWDSFTGYVLLDEIETNFNYSLWFNKKKRNEYNSQISNLRNVQDEFGYFQTGPIWKMPEPIGNGLMATTIFGVAAVAFSGYRFEEMFGEIYHASSMIIGAGFSLGMVLGLFTNSIHTGKQEIKKVKEQLYNRML